MKTINIKIDRSHSAPIYRQIVTQITNMINSGLIKSGNRLPTAKELFNQHGIARGTVKKAYDQLSRNGLIISIQGKGAFVRDESLQKGTIEVIDESLNSLTELSFTIDEIELLIEQELQKNRDAQERMNIAIVDSSPEILFDISNSLSVFSEIKITTFKLTRIQHKSRELFEKYKIIVATQDITTQLIAIRDDIQGTGTVIPIATVYSIKTLKELAKIRQQSMIGVFCKSKRYASIIREELSLLDNILVPRSMVLASQSDSILNNYLSNINVLLTTKNFKDYANDKQIDMIEHFRKNLGIVIELEYSIEQGSMMYIEEIIRRHRFMHYDILI